MRGVLLRWLILTAAVLAASWLLTGVRVNGIFPAILAAALNILTLGLFTFVINALMLLLVSAVIPGFDVLGFWTAFFGALIISVTSWLLNRFIGSAGRVETGDVIDLKQRGGRWE